MSKLQKEPVVDASFFCQFSRGLRTLFTVNIYPFSAVVRPALYTSLLLVALSVAVVHGQSPARSDKIMTLAELRSCMSLEQANKKATAEILKDQDGFKRDQDAVQAEQTEVNAASAELRARSAAIVAEREAISAGITALNALTQNAKTDAERATVESATAADRAKLIERSRVLEQSIDRFNASQQTLRDRVTALNTRVDAINQRNITVNDRVEPHRQQTTLWRDQCAGRRFREEDEIAIKKEMAAAK